LLSQVFLMILLNQLFVSALYDYETAIFKILHFKKNYKLNDFKYYRYERMNCPIFVLIKKTH